MVLQRLPMVQLPVVQLPVVRYGGNVQNYIIRFQWYFQNWLFIVILKIFISFQWFWWMLFFKYIEISFSAHLSVAKVLWVKNSFKNFCLKILFGWIFNIWPFIIIKINSFFVNFTTLKILYYFNIQKMNTKLLTSYS